MEELKNVPMVSLVVTKSNGTKEKVKFKNSLGDLQDEVELSVLDYMLTIYRDLDSFFQRGLANRWFDSTTCDVEIIGKDGRIYPLPYENGNRDIIFRASESAVNKGALSYITKGDKPNEVSNQELMDFFNNFLTNVLSDDGIMLIRSNYFTVPSFNELLISYYELRQKEDDPYSQMNAASLEKSYSVSKAPSTIEDYIRYYKLFRECVSFDKVCKLKKELDRIDEIGEVIKAPEIEESKISYEVKKEEPAKFESKRSLCFIIGNNCEPLILETMEATSLDDYIVDSFDSAKDVRRKFKDEITAYVYAHKDYVTSIRESIHNSSYTGQVAILEHDEDGKFKRTEEGMYFRYPVIYSDTFKHVKKLYCNIEKFRKAFKEASHESAKANNEYLVSRSLDLAGLKQDALELKQKEEMARIKGEDLTLIKGQMDEIITRMRELEKADYALSANDPTRERVFSPYVSRVIFKSANGITSPEYKKALDEWAKTMSGSDKDYDAIRFIMRELRFKQDRTLEQEETIYILDEPEEKTSTYDSMHLEQQEESEFVVDNSMTIDDSQKDEYLYPEEYAEMYGDGLPPEEVDPSSIHVMK